MRKKLNKILSFSILFALTSWQAQAQDLSGMGSTQLKDMANQMIQAGQYMQARPYMTVLIERIEQTPEKGSLESMYFFMGYSYLQEFDANRTQTDLLTKAIPFFDKVLADWPRGKLAQKALEFKAMCYNGLGDFDKAAETWAASLRPPYVDSLNYAQRFAVVKKISQAYYNKSNWELGLSWFLQMFSLSKNIDDKTYAAVAIIRAYLQEDKFEEASKYFTLLTSQAPARYDIYLSVDLLKMGDKLANQKRYAESSLCFTFVKTIEEVSKYMKDYSEKLEKRIETLKKVNEKDPRVTELDAKRQYAENVYKELEKQQSYTAQLLARSANNFYKTKRHYESLWAYRMLIEEYPDEEGNEDFYYAAFVCALKIGNEKLIDKMASEYREKYREGKYIVNINIEFAQFLLNTNQRDRFFEVADGALEATPMVDASAQYIFLEGKTYIETKHATDADRSKEFGLMRTKFEAFYTKNPQSPAASGALYWISMSYLIEGIYEKSYEYANKLLTEYPESIYKEDISYRRAVAMFGSSSIKNNIQNAKALFLDYLKDFRLTGKDLLGEAELFLGDIYFIDQDYDESYLHYMGVSDVTQKQSLINSAYYHCAGMLESAGRFEKQAEVLQKYIDTYPDADLAMASYMLSKPLFKQGRSADAVIGYMAAIKKYGEEAENDSVDKLIVAFPEFYAEAKKQLEVTTAFLQRIVNEEDFLKMFVLNPAKRYDYTLENEDVNPVVYAMFKIPMGEKKAEIGPEVLEDKAPLVALLKKYEEQMRKFPKAGVKEFFTKTMAEAKAAKEEVLEMRMLMALDEIGGLAQAPNMFSKDDFNGKSNRTLIWMAKFNEKYDVETSRDILTEVSKRDTEYRIDAFIALAELQVRKGQDEEAIKSYAEAENASPMDDKVPYLRMKVAELYIRMNKFDEALEKLNSILSDMIWPPLVQAEARYMLGMTEKNRGNLDAAIMHFDACALGFTAYYQFSGKAVLEGARICMQKNKKEQALEFCKTFLDDPNSKEAPEYKTIETFYKSI